MSKLTLEELKAIYYLPVFQLVDRARKVYTEHWPDPEIQLCTLLSVKTGGCSEDCGYCAQSAHHKTEVEAGKLMHKDEVLPIAEKALAEGATRFCMGAAWKGVREGDAKFNTVLETVEAVSKLGMEVCVTLGQLTPGAAKQLKDAGLTAYNHNLDTSPEYYPKIVTTHTYEDRLNTIESVQKAGISLCCGGIIGMGESVDDRLKLLEVLMGFNPPPESIPINCLMPIDGTPMDEQTPVPVFDLVRMIATTRIAFPKSKVRLSAGRSLLSREAQAWCFYAGANSIFYGEKLLTADNPEENSDRELLKELDLVGAKKSPQPV